ncbi:MAG: hypothetical protein K6T66_11440, partial [Peptococcaceae bacterium]|nr:hypothetical protein [Peptococcaceae bacterium]
FFYTPPPPPGVPPPRGGPPPGRARAISLAASAGVEVLARRCLVSLREVVLDGAVPVCLC